MGIPTNGLRKAIDEAGLLGIPKFFWDTWVAARPVVSTCRFSIFVVVAGGAILCLTGQGQEILIAFRPPSVEDFPKATFAYFEIAVAIWAFQSWYWARFILNFRFTSERDEDTIRGWLITWLPRVIGVGAYAIAIASLLLAGAYWLATGVTAGLGAAFVWFVWKRRKTLFPPRDATFADDWRGLPIGPKIFIWASFLLSVAGLVVFTIWTVGTAFFLGAGAVVFLALGLIVPAGSYLVYRTRKDGFPVIWGLLLWAVIVSLWMDNHGVRRFPADTATTHAEARPDVKSAAQGWWKCVERSGLPLVDGKQPLIVVATAGGAMRAALWTATVLAEGMKYRHFHDRLFAISGVSGGSVGAAFVTAHLREPGATTDPDPSKWLKQRIAKSMTKDYVAPVLAGLFFPDLVQRLWPFAWLPDRAEALEEGWEAGWRRDASKKSKETAGGLDARFRDFATYRDDGDSKCAERSPVLLFNGSHEERGKRIITANVKVTPDVFVNAYDFFDLAEGAIRLSTAAHNGARFPYLSPAGTMVAADGTKNGHIIDGGYFENFGAIAAAELLDAMPDDVRPIVILISSDPGLTRAEIEADDPTAPSARTWINEIVAPPIGLYAARSGRGILGAQELRRKTIEDLKGEFLHFRMCEVNGIKPGLGWSLSPESEKAIQVDYLSECGNDAVFERLGTLLGGKSAATASAATP